MTHYEKGGHRVNSTKQKSSSIIAYDSDCYYDEKHICTHCVLNTLTPKAGLLSVDDNFNFWQFVTNTCAYVSQMLSSDSKARQTSVAYIIQIKLYTQWAIWSHCVVCPIQINYYFFRVRCDQRQRQHREEKKPAIINIPNSSALFTFGDCMVWSLLTRVVSFIFVWAILEMMMCVCTAHRSKWLKICLRSHLISRVCLRLPTIDYYSASIA